MKELVDRSTGRKICDLSEDQFRLVSENLAFARLSRQVIDELRSKGVDEPVLSAMEAAIGEGKSIDVGPQDGPEDASYTVTGRVVHSETGDPLGGFKVEAYDKDLLLDDFLGACYCDESGRFAIGFEEEDFKGSKFIDLEGAPEVYLVISDRLDSRIKRVKVGAVKPEAELDCGDIAVKEAVIGDPEAIVVHRLANEIEGPAVSFALEDAEIPFAVEPFYSHAYDGLWGVSPSPGAKGQVWVPREYQERAQTVITECITDAKERQKKRTEEGEA